jgi:hypothetical protein
MEPELLLRAGKCHAPGILRILERSVGVCSDWSRFSLSHSCIEFRGAGKHRSFPHIRRASAVKHPGSWGL